MLKLSANISRMSCAVIGMGVLLLSSMSKAEVPPTFDHDRDPSLINTFQIMCNLELPNFSEIAVKANAMKMQMQLDQEKPSDGDTVLRTKGWTGSLATGPWFLMIDELRGPKGVSTSCAVGGGVADFNAFRSEMTKEMKLPPVTPYDNPDGLLSYDWAGYAGPGTTLILRRSVQAGQQSVMIKLLNMVQSTGNTP